MCSNLTLACYNLFLFFFFFHFPLLLYIHIFYFLSFFLDVCISFFFSFTATIFFFFPFSAFFNILSISILASLLMLAIKPLKKLVYFSCSNVSHSLSPFVYLSHFLLMKWHNSYTWSGVHKKHVYIHLETFWSFQVRKSIFIMISLLCLTSQSTWYII